MRKIGSHRQSVLYVARSPSQRPSLSISHNRSVSFMFSGVMSMLSNVAFILEDHYVINELYSSLLIGLKSLSSLLLLPCVAARAPTHYYTYAQLYSVHDDTRRCDRHRIGSPEAATSLAVPSRNGECPCMAGPSAVARLWRLSRAVYCWQLVCLSSYQSSPRRTGDQSIACVAGDYGFSCVLRVETGRGGWSWCAFMRWC
jgi:hypothetical protein